MNIVAFALSLFAAIFSGVTVLAGAAVPGWAASGTLGLQVAGVIVMFSALWGLVGGGMALTRRERASILLGVDAGLAAAAFFLGLHSAVVWAVLYLLAAILARLDVNALREDPSALAARTDGEPPRLPGMLRAMHVFLEAPVEGEEQELDGRVQLLRDDALQPVESLVGVETGALVRRAFIFLEDGEFARADQYLEQALTQDPENSRAYLGKLMVELGARTPEALADAPLFEQSRLFQRALKFAADEERAVLNGYVEARNRRLERLREERQAELEGRYKRAQALSASAETQEDLDELMKLLESLEGHKDVRKLVEDAQRGIEAKKMYDEAVSMLERAQTPADYDKLAAVLEELGSYRDTPALAARARMERRYAELIRLKEQARTEEELEEVAEHFDGFGSYRDAQQLAADARRLSKEARRAAKIAAARRAVLRRWVRRVLFAAALVCFILFGGGRWLAGLFGYVPAPTEEPVTARPDERSKDVLPLKEGAKEPDKAKEVARPHEREVSSGAVAVSVVPSRTLEPPTSSDSSDPAGPGVQEKGATVSESVTPPAKPAKASHEASRDARIAVVRVASSELEDLPTSEDDQPNAASEDVGTVAPMRVSGSRVNLRSAPTLTAQVLARMSRGDLVDATESRTAADGVWYHVSTDKGIEGWISGRYLRDR